jgi:hypothetical protein
VYQRYDSAITISIQSAAVKKYLDISARPVSSDDAVRDKSCMIILVLVRQTTGVYGPMKLGLSM